VLLKLLVRNHDNLFVLAEIAHFSGIGFLLYKLTRVESCEGASVRAPPCPPRPTALRSATALGFTERIGLRASRRAHAAPRPTARSALGALLRALRADASRLAARRPARLRGAQAFR
jgi:hypothetical protein